MFAIWAVVLTGVGCLLLWQAIRLLGLLRGSVAVTVMGATLACLVWWTLERASAESPPIWESVASVSSSACAKCHPDHHDSWHRTFHRTMTREASPETVRGAFDDLTLDYQGLPVRFQKKDDRYFMTLVDPGWSALRAQTGNAGAATLPPPRFTTFRVDRTVGSHWIQEYLHKAPDGRYLRLPMLFNITEQRWVQNHGAFLAPDSADFWGKTRGFTWNDTCLYCHNTGPIKNPLTGPRGEFAGFRTEVAELGISCEACHGPGETHVRLNQDPARRYALQLSGKGDPSIVHPERLTVGRRDEICARCHGALVPKKDMWDPVTHRDPFIPGMELTRFNFHFWSEAQQAKLAADQREPALPLKPAPTDGRFWGDGTPLTTALEYNGMALSKCYLNGQGDMSCLSCHTMHPDNPNLMLKPGMDGNEACFQCHSQFRNQLEEHTRHAPGSPGSLCFNCHMPHQVFSLMTTHRSHRIQVPTIQDSLGTGKPHACNLCHLDKSLGWTRDQLRKWSPGLGESRPSLSPEEETLPAALLLLTQGDARTRAVVAGAFMKGAFRQTGQHEWAGPLLTAVLEKETYPMVRDVLARALRSLYGDEIARGYQPQDLPNRRDQQLRWLRDRMGSPRLNPGRSGFPLRPDGSLDVSAILKRIESRPDPHVTINE